MLGTNSLPHTWESLTETGTWCALYVTVFSSCPLYLDYFDSKRAHTVMHPRLCMSPLLPKGNSGTYGRWLMERMHEGVGGQRRGKKNTGGTQGLIKKLINFGEHSFGAASHSYPAIHFLASDPVSLNTHSAPSFSSSLSPVPTRPRLT